MFEHILVPLDGSEVSEAILGQVARMLRLKEAHVTLFRAVPIMMQPTMEFAPIVIDLQTDAREYITALERNLRKEGVDVRGVVRVGEEAYGIIETAKEQKATLIAMSSHGRSGLSRFFLGSVAEKILRTSEIPVLLVRSFEKAAVGARRTPAQEIPIRRILMPVDGSDSSLAAVPQVVALAKAVGASVIVLGVVQPSREGKGDGDPLLRIAVKQLADAGIQVDPVLRIGDPASEILDACTRHNVDLLVMSTHGRSGVSRWVMGSVTEKVLRHAEVPMLVVRAKK